MNLHFLFCYLFHELLSFLRVVFYMEPKILKFKNIFSTLSLLRHVQKPRGIIEFSCFYAKILTFYIVC
jgi:hypothetical protein